MEEELKTQVVSKINEQLLYPHCGCKGRVKEASEWSYYPEPTLSNYDTLVEKLKTTLTCLNCDIVWKVL
jgi:hypothetical protein